eukprot:5389482-Ditylum_brightwellii.AAC.1
MDFHAELLNKTGFLEALNILNPNSVPFTPNKRKVGESYPGAMWKYMDNKQDMVFYNAYTDPNNPSVSNDIIKEQMLQRLPEHCRAFVHSIGPPVNVKDAI